MMQEAEVMEKSKEKLIEELMAKLKYDLQKGQKQAANKGDIAEKDLKDGGQVQKGVVVEMKAEMKTYTCRKLGCGKKFVKRGLLRRHIKAVHINARPHHCREPGCDKKFGRKDHLSLHRKRMHLMERPYQCDELGCDKSFVRRCDLK